MSDLVIERVPDEVRLRTLEKGLSVLEEVALAGRRGMHVAELGRRLHLNRTTLHRFLSTLLRRGYVEQDGVSDRYRLGFKILEVASATIAGLSIRDVGGPILEDLYQATQETVHVVTLDHGELVTLDRLVGEHPISYRTEVGARRPAYCTATGKAVLAFMSDEVVDEILARGMPPRAAHTITDPLAYKNALQETRIRGFAVDDEELADGIRCVAAPVFDFSGRVAGAISLAAPTVRVDMQRLLELAGPVTEAARRLSRQLGYRPG